MTNYFHRHCEERPQGGPEGVSAANNLLTGIIHPLPYFYKSFVYVSWKSVLISISSRHSQLLRRVRRMVELVFG